MTPRVGMVARAAAVGLLGLILGVLGSAETASAQSHALTPVSGQGTSGDEAEDLIISYQITLNGNLAAQTTYECRLDLANMTATAADIVGGTTTVQVTLQPKVYSGTETDEAGRCSFPIFDDDIVEENETVVVKLYRQGEVTELDSETYTINDIDETTIYITRDGGTSLRDDRTLNAYGVGIRICTTNGIGPRITEIDWRTQSGAETNHADFGRPSGSGQPRGGAPLGPNANAGTCFRAEMQIVPDAWDEDDEEFTLAVVKDVPQGQGTASIIPASIKSRVNFGDDDDDTRNATITITILADPEEIELNFGEAVYNPTEGDRLNVIINMGRPVIASDTGDKTFVILVEPVGGIDPAADYSVGTGTAITDPANGYVITVPVDTRPMQVRIDITRDDLWEFGEQLQLSFADSASQWNGELFTAGTGQATAVINIRESTDLPNIRLTASPSIVTETLGKTTSTIGFTVDSRGNFGALPDNHSIVLSFAGADKGADANSGDFQISSETLSTSTRTATLTARDDSTAEPDGETLTISAHVTNGAGQTALGISIPDITVTIHDALSITWAATSGTVAETDTGASVPHTITIMSNAPPAVDLSIGLALDASSVAIEGDLVDFTTASFALPEDGSQLSPSVTLNVRNDDVAEIAEALVLNLEGTAGAFPTAALTSESYTLTITDTLDTVEITLGNPRTQGRTFTFPIELSNGIGIDVRVPWSIALADLVTAGDFTDASGHVDIDAGSDETTAIPLTITATDDGNGGEGEETFTVTLGAPTKRDDTSPTELGDRLTLGADRQSRGTIASDTNGITMRFYPASVTEGDGIVDVAIRPTLGGAIIGGTQTFLTVALAANPSGGTASAQDFMVVGTVTNGGFTGETTSEGTLPSVRMGHGQSYGFGYLQLRVLKDEEDEPEETIAFSVTPSGYATFSTSPGDVLIPIATAQFAAHETRIAQKQVLLSGVADKGWDFDRENDNGIISSAGFMIDSVAYQLQEVSQRDSDRRITIRVNRPVPSGLYWRLTSSSGGGSTDLITRAATTAEPINSFMPNGEWRYRWDPAEDSSLTLPSFPVNTWISLDILNVDEATAFADNASMADQTWHHNTPVELALPAVVAGNEPITYTLVGTLPAGVALVTAAADLPSGSTYTGEYPVLLGTPTTSAVPRSFTYRASDADGQAAELTFNIGVAPGPPTNIRVTQLHLGFHVDWDAPVISNPAVMITGYDLELRCCGQITWWIRPPTVPSPSGNLQQTSYATASTFNLQDLSEGSITMDFRIYTLSNAGRSLVSEEVTGNVVAKDISPIANLTARATGPQMIALSWTAPRVGALGAEIDNYTIRRTASTADDPMDSEWTTLSTQVDAAAISYTDMSLELESSTRYFYEIRTRVTGVNSEWSNRADATTLAPGPPSTLAAPTLTVERTRITIGWEAPESTGGSTILGYEVEVREGATGTPAILKDNSTDTYTTDGTTTMYVHSNVNPGSSYSYRVRAANSGSSGDWSPAAVAATWLAAPVPTIAPVFGVAPGEFDVTVRFSEPVDDFDDATDVTVTPAEFATAGRPVSSGQSGQRKRVFTVPITATELKTGEAVLTIAIAADVAEAVADDVDNFAAQSITVTMDSILPTVTSFTSDAPTTVNGRFEVEVGFSEAMRRLGPDSFECTNCFAQYATAALAAGNRFVVGIVPTTVTPENNQVSVRVAARGVQDLAGNPNRLASDTIMRTAANLQAPGAPTNLRATGGLRVNVLTWSAPAGTGSTVFLSGYRVQWYDSGRSEWRNLAENTGNEETTYRHENLRDGTTYRYRVKAIGGGGESGWSNEATATTAAPSDINNDGRVTAGDGLVLLQMLQGLPQDQAVRRTLLTPHLSPEVDRDDQQAVDAAIEDLMAGNASQVLPDINRDNRRNELDAVLIYNVLAFPELVGNGGSLPGFDRYRAILIDPYRGSRTVEQVIDAVHGLNP